MYMCACATYTHTHTSISDLCLEYLFKHFFFFNFLSPPEQKYVQPFKYLAVFWGFFFLSSKNTCRYQFFQL